MPINEKKKRFSALLKHRFPNMSGYEIAEALGVPHSTVMTWINARYLPDEDYRAEIAEKLNHTPTSLENYLNGEPPKATLSTAEIIASIPGFPFADFMKIRAAVYEHESKLLLQKCKAEPTV